MIAVRNSFCYKGLNKGSKVIDDVNYGRAH